MNNKKAKSIRKAAKFLAAKLELPALEYYVKANEVYRKAYKAVTNLAGEDIYVDYDVCTTRLKRQCERALYQAMKRDYKEEICKNT